MRIIGSVFIIVLILLGARIYFLQVHPVSDVLNNYTNEQVEVTSDNSFNVYDKNMVDLCDYNKKYIIVIDKKPFSLNNYENTLEELIAFNFIMKNESDEFNFTDIMKNDGKTYFEVSKETFDKVNKLKNIKGVYSYERSEIEKNFAWNNGNMFQSIADNDDYVSGSLQYNIHEIIKDNQKRYKNFYIDDDAKYEGSSELVPDDNKNIMLTVDNNIENKIKDILKDDKYSNEKNIGVTIMESATGKVCAMVQKDDSMANVNLCMEGGGYEPGSIFKVITLASALEEGKITMNDEFVCRGNICKEGAHGRLNVYNAFVKSCNDIFAEVGAKVSYDKIIYYAKECGLFKRTFDMQGETLGNLPKEEDGINNISIGQCITASPVQMLGAVNTVINNGVYVKPYIVDKVLDKDGNTVFEYNAEKRNVFSKTTALQVKRAMREVVVSGTGKKANIDGLTIAGKTGSATSGDGLSTHCWFVGFFEQNQKTYSMIVCVPDVDDALNENVGGGDIAAPIFKDIVSNINIK